MVYRRAKRTAPRENPPPAPRHAMRRNVSFGDVRVRFHERTISDNPAVASGVAIGLDWQHFDAPEALPLPEYEKSRRRLRVLWIHPHRRREIVLASGVSAEEAREMKRSILLAQQIRIASLPPHLALNQALPFAARAARRGMLALTSGLRRTKSMNDLGSRADAGAVAPLAFDDSSIGGSRLDALASPSAMDVSLRRAGRPIEANEILDESAHGR